MNGRIIIGIDQSTQGTKAILMDSRGELLGKSFLSHRQLINDQGWVSHDGEEIVRNVGLVVRDLLEKANVSEQDVSAIGISNQRETTIAWDRETGKPVDHAIVWQCARAKEITASMDAEFAAKVKERTGIPLSPYFPAAKAAWIFRNQPLARELAEEGKLCIGTVDAWLVFKLTGGKVFRTDYSNASRTQLFNLHTLRWDEEICEGFGIPVSALPEVTDCFWHGHDCRNTRPDANAEYWNAKRERNIKHDAEITARFESRGWKVLRIWECELKKSNRKSLEEKIKSALSAV